MSAFFARRLLSLQEERMAIEKYLQQWELALSSQCQQKPARQCKCGKQVENDTVGVEGTSGARGRVPALHRELLSAPGNVGSAWLDLLVFKEKPGI